MDIAHEKWPALEAALKDLGPVVIAVSGGLDSLTLAVAASRVLGPAVLAVHALGPAVPAADSRRVKEMAKYHGLALETVTPGEMDDPAYRANPVDRCFHCKTRLFTSLAALAKTRPAPASALASGANVSDLGEYRPGLEAAKNFGVRHPLIEAGLTKPDVRALARAMDLPFAELPASPCLASRLYTGTPVTIERLAAIAFAEGLFKLLTRHEVVRCRLKGQTMLVELDPGVMATAADPKHVIDAVDHLRAAVTRHHPVVTEVLLDPEGYRSGKACGGVRP